jgi:hypothetical protein
MELITLLYYVLTAFVVVILVLNFIKATRWEKEILYIIVLLPFVLRLLRLK